MQVNNTSHLCPATFSCSSRFMDLSINTTNVTTIITGVGTNGSNEGKTLTISKVPDLLRSYCSKPGFAFSWHACHAFVFAGCYDYVVSELGLHLCRIQDESVDRLRWFVRVKYLGIDYHTGRWADYGYVQSAKVAVCIGSHGYQFMIYHNFSEVTTFISSRRNLYQYQSWFIGVCVVGWFLFIEKVRPPSFKMLHQVFLTLTIILFHPPFILTFHHLLFVRKFLNLFIWYLLDSDLLKVNYSLFWILELWAIVNYNLFSFLDVTFGKYESPIPIPNFIKIRILIMINERP